MADYIINISSLQSRKSDLDSLKSKASNIYNEFASSTLANLGGEISSLSQKLKTPMERFNNGYKNSSTWLDGYISEFQSLESNLASFSSNTLDKPVMFSKKFTDIFKKATIPTLKTATTDASTVNDTQIAIGSGGQFVAKNSKGVYGYIISSMDGKQHVVFRQSEIKGWATNCNRAAAASIASAFAKNPWDAVTSAKRGGIGYNSKVTNDYFSKFGLTANVRRVNGSYDSIKNDLVNNLRKGNYVMFDLSQPNVRGKSGQKWTSTRHWLSILDIKKTGSGPNDYAIFVSDSGHKGSTINHGLGTGWYSINEFSGQRIANFTTIRKKS